MILEAGRRIALDKELIGDVLMQIGLAHHIKSTGINPLGQSRQWGMCLLLVGQNQVCIYSQLGVPSPHLLLAHLAQPASRFSSAVVCFKTALGSAAANILMAVVYRSSV